MRVTRCISFDPVRDKALLDYIDGASNASAEIRELLRLKLGTSKGDPFIKKIVQEVLNQLDVTALKVETNEKNKTEDEVAKNTLDEADIDAIKSILNMK